MKNKLINIYIFSVLLFLALQSFLALFNMDYVIGSFFKESLHLFFVAFASCLIPFFFFYPFVLPNRKKYFNFFSQISLLLFLIGILVGLFSRLPNIVSSQGGWVIYPPLNALKNKSHPSQNLYLNLLFAETIFYLLTITINAVAILYYLIILLYDKVFPKKSRLLIFTLSFAALLSLTFCSSLIFLIIDTHFLGNWNLSTIYLNGIEIPGEMSYFSIITSFFIIISDKIFLITICIFLIYFFKKLSETKIILSYFILTVIAFLIGIILAFIRTSNVIDVQLHDTYYVYSDTTYVPEFVILPILGVTISLMIYKNEQKIQAWAIWTNFIFTTTALAYMILKVVSLKYFLPRYYNFSNFSNQNLNIFQQFFVLSILLYGTGQLILLVNYLYLNFIKKSKSV